MATLSSSLRHVKAHLHEFISDQDIFQICTHLRYTWRNRLLNPAVTVQVFVLQLLAKVAMDGLQRVVAVPVSAQAICQAKKRLPLQLLIELVARSVPRSLSQQQP